jgi:sulfide:quinone oxidoreductase
MEKIVPLTPFLSVAPQITEQDVGMLAAHGFRSILNNRPDGEAEGQPTSGAIEAAARRHGLAYRHIPVASGKITDADVMCFAEAMTDLKGPVLAFCRTGTRSTSLWALSEASHLDPDAVLKTCGAAGYHLEGLRPRLEARWRTEREIEGAGADAPGTQRGKTYDVAVIGGGAAGIATSASLLRRRPGLKIAIVEPGERHYYQPGWTLVGGGVFDRRQTERTMAEVMPHGVEWIRAAAAAFEPERNAVVLENGERLQYRVLVVCPGIKLDWDGIEGLLETLGRNGVTSNYLFDMAPYTWELVQSLRSGRALFTQPMMPIKCAGAPQKAMYLSCDHWLRRGVLRDIEVEFDLAGAALFGVKEFVPPLMKYVERYGAALAFNSTLKAVDGDARKAWFEVKDPNGDAKQIEKTFDLLHVCPPQTAPDFVRQSPLADAAGWIEVNPETLQHPRYGNVFGLGDACSAPNAKTAAAARKQAPVVAENVLSILGGRGPRALYDGYGSCPLTVERGKIVLAEFGYGGKLLPTFPFIKSTKPSRLAWLLKERMLPRIYFDLMLKGREWLAEPTRLPHEPQPHEAGAALADGGAPGAGSPQAKRAS